MSRIGNTPVAVPNDVTITVADHSVVVKGPKGELTLPVPAVLSVTQKDGSIIVTPNTEAKKVNALHGTMSAELANAVAGVTRGWTKQLELSGVGYRAVVNGVNLVLNVGFSHSVTITPPPGITFVATDTKITVSGMSKYLVGQVAASIRGVKPPEPYKGKGVRYSGEHIRKKAGKSAKAVGGAPGAK